MKSKLYAKIAFYTLLIGWFPFMWIAAFASWNREFGLFVLFVGMAICGCASLLVLPITENNDLFKSIDQLEEERYKYYEATKRLEKKIKQL